VAKSYPHQPKWPENVPPPIYFHYRTCTVSGWSWAIEVPGAGYIVRNATGRMVARGAKTWKRAADWTLANCHREDLAQ
jgi:hypothetical protein